MSGLLAFPVAVVIVGAGAGTRFGEPKAYALLPDGRSFAEAIVETARHAGVSTIVAVLPPGDATNVLRERDTARTTGGAALTVVTNANPKSEQIASVRLGLAALSNSPAVGALLWPVDHPFPSLMSVLAVLDAAKRTGAPFVVPAFEGRRGHPLFAHRDTWRELLTVADGGARAVVRGYGDRVAAVPVNDRGVLRDIDVRGDLAE